MHHQIAIHISDSSLTESNNLLLTLKINADKELIINKTSHYLIPGRIYVFLYTNREKIGTVNNLSLTWTTKGNAGKTDTLAVHCIEVNHMSHSNKRSVCVNVRTCLIINVMQSFQNSR